MKTGRKLVLCLLAALAMLIGAVCTGSAAVAPGQIAAVLANRLAGAALPEDLPAAVVSIVWQIRLPRALCAFFVGAALAASGTVMQSVLQNPLASSYTLGASSGAALGAALVIVSGVSLPLLGALTLPAAGFAFGLLTVVAALALSARIDRRMENQTVILIGMVLSLFVNALLTLLSAMYQSHLQQLILWQMGSFSGRSWLQLAVLAPVTLAGVLALCFFAREMDLLSFSEERARALGVETRRVKWILIVLASLLTGTAVCFTGIIGFVDLIAPHVVRRVFGPAHRLLLPLSALFGGVFLAAADTLARTVLAPVELPVGAVTALVGAPFFAWVYFKKGGRGR